MNLRELARGAKLPWMLDRMKVSVETASTRRTHTHARCTTIKDAAYIAAACNAVPSLLDENDRLRERVAALERQISMFDGLDGIAAQYPIHSTAQRCDRKDGTSPPYRFTGTVCGYYVNPETATPGIVISSYAEPGCIQIFADYMVEVAAAAEP